MLPAIPQPPILPPHVLLGGGPGRENLTADYLIFRNLSTGRPMLQPPPPPGPLAGGSGTPEDIEPPINVWDLKSGIF